jgi:hypothetical protein
MMLRARNWREFQHYTKRRPPWIKLHHKLLDDRVFLTLPVASRALAPMLWLLASECDDGSIKDAIAEIVFRLRMSEQDAREALAPLIATGFFVCVQDGSSSAGTGASALPATPLHQTEERRGKAPTGLSPDSDAETSRPVAARASLEGSAHDGEWGGERGGERKIFIPIKRMAT